MPRLHQVARGESASPIVETAYGLVFGDRDPVAQPGTATGTAGDWWTIFANSPDCLAHNMQGFGFYLSKDRKLDPALRELAQTWAGWATGSQFVYSQHCKSLRAAKVGEEKIAALPVWQTAGCFDPKERLVLAYADRLVMHHGRVPDALFAALRASFDDEEIIELTYITCFYAMQAVMSKALRTELDDRDDPVVEAPLPAKVP